MYGKFCRLPSRVHFNDPGDIIGYHNAHDIVTTAAVSAFVETDGEDLKLAVLWRARPSRERERGCSVRDTSTAAVRLRGGGRGGGPDKRRRPIDSGPPTPHRCAGSPSSEIPSSCGGAGIARRERAFARRSG